MPEERIVITIDEEGRIEAKTSGFTGESCIEALDDLLKLDANVKQVKKTDEFVQPSKQTKKRTIQNTRGDS